MHTYIIAEMSANHCGDKEIAKRIIKTAKEIGADAIKVQTYTADTITIDCDSEIFRTKEGSLWEGQTLYQLYSKAYTPWEWQGELKKYADELGIDFFSTPFDYTAVDFLESIDVPRYKIASFEAIDYPLIRYAAAKGKPMIISTGISSLDEIQEAVDACKQMGNNDITLLKCTSAYPAKPADMNLLTIRDMIERFGPQGVKVGLSDHSMRVEPVVAAVALGATVIEKHMTLDRALGGEDSGFSLNAEEFADMVKVVRNKPSAKWIILSTKTIAPTPALSSPCRTSKKATSSPRKMFAPFVPPAVCTRATTIPCLANPLPRTRHLVPLWIRTSCSLENYVSPRG